MVKRSRMSIFGMFVLVAGLIYCLLGSFSPLAANAFGKEVVWAILDDLSGPYSATGEESVNAVRLFLEESGNKLGPFKVKLVMRDTELKPAVAVRRLQELLSEERPLVVSSGCSSGVQLAIADVIGKSKSCIFWTDGWDTRLTGELGNRYTFRWASPNFTIARASVSGFLGKNPGVKKVICLMLDYAWGYDMMKNAQEVFRERGIKVLKVQYIPVTSSDASVFMTEAKESGADAYILGLYGKLLGIGLRQAHDFGLKKVMKVMSVAGTLNMIRGVGCEALNGIYLGDHWNHVMNNNWSREFVTKYKKRWGKIPGDYAAAKYLEIQLMDRVLRETGQADPKVLIPALENIGTFEGPTGKERVAGWYHQIEHEFLLEQGKPCSQVRYPDDLVKIVGGAKVYPKPGMKGFNFDRMKEPL